MAEPRGRSRLARADAGFVALLFGLPALVLTVPALAGYPLITGDDLVQSYPLSELAGAMLRHGHLPVFDPYLWSGSPLLAGANAHALFPTTALFAVLPGLAAWVVSEIVVLGATATGAYVLSRWRGCRPASAMLSGATFGLGGFISSQIVHIDFVSAGGCLVWVLVGLHGLATADPRHRPACAVLTGAALAGISLAASPDMAVDLLVAVAIYGTHLLRAAPRSTRVPLVGWAVAAGLAGLALGAVQWLPTADFLSVSERAKANLSFASAGSVSPVQLLVSVVPHVLGGGPLGLRPYLGPYNLSELDCYCGVLALSALGALAACWRAERSARWKVWCLIGGAGLLLALGSNTPLERLIVDLPVLGQQRLPSRALVLVSLGLSMLLGEFCEGLTTAGSVMRSRPALYGALVGPGAVLGVVLATAITGRPYAGLLDPVAGSTVAWRVGAVGWYLVAAGLVALGAVGAVFVARSSEPRRGALAIGVVVAVDLVLFTVNQSSLAPTYARDLGRPNALERRLASTIGPGGRFLVVDPSRSAGQALDQIGAPNFSVLYGLSSAQGYGSLTWAPYEAATGTHSQDDLWPAALSSAVFDSLSVRVLLTVPGELITPISPGGQSPSGPVAGSGEPATFPGLGAPPVAVTGPVPAPLDLGPRSSVIRWFGRPLSVTAVSLVGFAGSTDPAETARFARSVRLVGASGTRLAPVSVRRSGSVVVVQFPTDRNVVGVGFANPLTRRVSASRVTISGASGAFSLDGALSAWLTGPHWAPLTRIGPLEAFANRSSLPPLRVVARRGASSGDFGSGTSPVLGARVEVISNSATSGTETIKVVSPQPGLLVRSMSALPGWHATVRASGRSSPGTVETFGLVQAVAVQAGVSEVTFSYDAPGLGSGLVLSSVGLAALIAMTAAGFGVRRRSSAARSGHRTSETAPRRSRTHIRRAVESS